MFDLFSGMMFIVACSMGRQHGSLFAGALVGCFVVYAHFWCGWILCYTMRKSCSKRVREIRFAIGLLLIVFFLAIAYILPSNFISFANSFSCFVL